MTRQSSRPARDTANGRIRGQPPANGPAARALRQKLTPAEHVLWQQLRAHRLAGLHFRRQHPAGPFVVDFACAARLLAVEVDGAVHDDQAVQDAARSEILATHGWQVLRFTNDEVLTDLPSVLDRIRTAALARPLGAGRSAPSPALRADPPPSLGEGGGTDGQVLEPDDKGSGPEVCSPCSAIASPTTAGASPANPESPAPIKPSPRLGGGSARRAGEGAS